jgi:GH15 family glucan-1,4-alpha-glucosidase
MEILFGKAVIEIKPRLFSKGSAVCELMTHPPFAGRTPLFIGDDITDESVFGLLPQARRDRLFGGPDHTRRAGDLPIARACPVLACAALHPFEACLMNDFNDFGLDLAVIGNGQTAALLEPASRLVWWCYPRFDGDPVFSRPACRRRGEGLLRHRLDDMVDYSSDYERNTPVVSTVLTNSQNASVKITDFAPRFRNYERIFRPPQLMRIIEPVAGLPRIAIRVRPTADYGSPITDRSVGSNHISYRANGLAIRLTTDGPLSYIEREDTFVLTKPIHMVFGPDEPLVEDIATTCREFADRTRDYWVEWVRRLSIAYEWQDAIIRAAIALKLSNFEETGGVVAALTTSIPEAPGSGRTWDYRYCWMRDAYFVVKALNRLGATKTMEGFISFILGIASEEVVRPVYGVVPDHAARRDDSAQPQGLSQRRASQGRQCRGLPEPA